MPWISCTGSRDAGGAGAARPDVAGMLTWCRKVALPRYGKTRHNVRDLKTGGQTRNPASQWRIRMKRQVIGLLAGVAFAAASGAALAHHSFAMFDQDHPMDLQGTVTE